ncbi:MAG TPA: GNAT family N-acetyltransferase, partial [Candidatus Dormibacteraeota bacterium]|nr:GNAT family N-acetyltransferase [Candidatus Dormibacteraeota bacterium]
MRPVDRSRIAEISAGVWGGNDYLMEVFDSWVSDPGASFQAAEVDGIVVAVHRLRPIARGVMYYEGLRVAEDHRRRGIGRAMLQEAIREARGLRFRLVRLYTGNPQ